MLLNQTLITVIQEFNMHGDALHKGNTEKANPLLPYFQR